MDKDYMRNRHIHEVFERIRRDRSCRQIIKKWAAQGNAEYAAAMNLWNEYIKQIRLNRSHPAGRYVRALP